MNLTALLEERARLHPERPALVDSRHGRDRVVTFAGLSRRVSAGACALHDTGLRRGQAVLVFQPVSIELYEFLLAAFHSGIRVMLADPSAGREFLALCCQRLMPDAYFGSWKAQCLRLAVPALRRIDKAIAAGPWFPGAVRWRTDHGKLPMVEVPDDEPALITFTSGSTGMPKAAVRTHGFLLAQHRELSQSLGFEDGETDLITLPVFVLANLASGLTSVLAATDLAHPGKPDAEAIRGQCARHGVTRCTASPAFFEGLLKSPRGMPAFRKVFTGGAPVFPDLLRRLRAALPDAEIHSVYGSTEAEPIAHFSHDEADAETAAITRRGGGLCSGVPVSAIHLKIIADRWGEPLGPMDEAEFSRMEIPSGQVGEIVVAGNHVLGGYLDGIGDDETKIHVDGGVWHRTGDAGWIDAEGRLWLLGRCSAKLPTFAAPPGIPAEALRYPFAIECALREKFPGIRTAAIEWQGRRLLVVGKQTDTEETEAIRAVSRDLGMDDLVCLEALPLDRRHNAKIDYPALRGILERRKAAC
ncbi:MAG: AMP-binding protein [Akkermansiaceae bacterium]|nr:AMP-binding protein [Akkermansiaceae bacterium]